MLGRLAQLARVHRAVLHGDLPDNLHHGGELFLRDQDHFVEHAG